MLTLYKKELSSFLNSIIGYIVIIIFLLITSLFLWIFETDVNILNSGYASIDGLFIMAPYVFLFLIPAITMRFFAEERRTGTIELLLTKPITDIQIITSKFLAGLTLVLFSLLPTLIYFVSVYYLGFPKGNIDLGGMWGSYIGLLFLGASFVSIGVFASSLSDNQIVAFVLAIFLSAFLFIGFQFLGSLALFGKFDLFLYSLSISAHYSSISRGVVDTRDIIYFLSIITLFIVFTKMSLESRKW